MRALLLLWVAALVSAALALPLTTETAETSIATEVEPPSAGRYVVRVSADPGIEYRYEIGDDVLVLHLSVFRGTPCEEVSVESEELGDNRFRVVVHVVPTAEMCIQVVPPEPAKETVRLKLDPETPKVHVRIERMRASIRPPQPDINIPEVRIPELPPEFPEPEKPKFPRPGTPEECNDLLRRIVELEKNEPELAMRLRWLYQERCLLPDRCEWILEAIERLKERGEDVNAGLQRLMLLYEKCRAIQPLPIGPLPETPIEIINRTAEIKRALEEENTLEALRAEIERLKRAVQELKQALEKTEEKIEIIAQQLVSMVRVSPGKIVVEGEELALPSAEIVVDQNRGLKVRIEKSEVVLEANRAQARANIEISVTPEGEIISAVSGKSIAVDPDQVVEKARRVVKEVLQIRLVDDGRAPKYVVEGETEGRLLWILPVRFRVEVEVDAEQGTIIAERRPWWSFLVFS